MKKLLSILAIALLAGCNGNAQTTDLSTTEFESGIAKEGSQLLDVRTPEEYNEGHLENSLLANWYEEETFQAKAMTLDPKKPVYVYCRSGARSSSALKWLQDKGFKEVYNLDGGILAWQKDGKPVVKPE